MEGVDCTVAECFGGIELGCEEFEGFDEGIGSNSKLLDTFP